MSEVILSPAEIRSRIEALETKYGFSSREFSSNSSLRDQMSGEDEFEWEACLTHIEVLREHDVEVLRSYLAYGVTMDRAAAEKDVAAELLAA